MSLHQVTRKPHQQHIHEGDWKTLKASEKKAYVERNRYISLIPLPTPLGEAKWLRRWNADTQVKGSSPHHNMDALSKASHSSALGHHSMAAMWQGTQKFHFIIQMTNNGPRTHIYNFYY